MTLWERIKYSMVRPDDDPSEPEEEVIRPVEEIEANISRSNDKERAIGLVAAPVAALIGLIISSASINYAKTHNQSVAVYDKLTYVLLGLAALILITSWLRKRLFQGITLALYGLAIFQLHYTYFGFAAPFLLAGAWYLVRAYRLQQELKRAQAAGPDAPRPKTNPGTAPRPRRNKRYTPPT
jgi:Ca2+/Na+ antiporter